MSSLSESFPLISYLSGLDFTDFYWYETVILNDNHINRNLTLVPLLTDDLEISSKGETSFLPTLLIWKYKRKTTRGQGLGVPYSGRVKLKRRVVSGGPKDVGFN